MTTNKHTPGPWERLPGEAEVGHPIYKPGKMVMRIVQKRPIGQTKFNRVALVDSENVVGDAALIVAAPDLLAALKDVIRLELGETYTGSTPEQVEGMKRVRAAIAKAEGR